MKIALLLTGHSRSWKTCFPSLKKYVLDKYNPDIFIHTWDTPNIKTLNSPFLYDEEHFEEYFKPVKIVYENLEKLTSYITKKSNYFTKIGPYDSPFITISQHRKWFLCNKLKSEYEKEHGFKYDLVIKARPDLIYYSDINLETFDDPSVVYTCNECSYETVSDLFTVSTSQNIDKYCKIYFNDRRIYDKYLNTRYGIFNPHNVLMNYFKDINLQYVKINMNIDIKR